MNRMSDLISRQAALDIINQYDSASIKLFGEPIRGLASILADIEDLPSAQPEYDLDGYSSRLWKAAYERGKQDAEQERKTGRWVATPSTYHYCSLCRMAAHLDYYGNEVTSNFCPNCGAQMVEDDPSHPFADDVMMG